jgi:uncharacterized protein YceK
MSKPLILVATLLLLAGCNAGPTEPAASNGLEPSFLNNTTGCATATDRTDGTPGKARVIAACEKGQGQGQ